ncbi:hypothetical protein TrRE_jg5191 [Triparma retinervis]|uniref:Uncharacterized protein n=1 Tax=Triparma retinervis TaxID=2557542 RepID=A0A9W6ZHZ9_9STRA|nr:hypothetical protein TrRE_jg5191 [Triparma retinervis]
MGDMDLGTLSLEQLNQFKQQEEAKLQSITRKIDLVGKNADGLLQVVGQTRKNIEAIIMTMQGKMDEIRTKRGAMMGSAN